MPFLKKTKKSPTLKPNKSTWIKEFPSRRLFLGFISKKQIPPRRKILM